MECLSDVYFDPRVGRAKKTDVEYHDVLHIDDGGRRGCFDHTSPLREELVGRATVHGGERDIYIYLRWGHQLASKGPRRSRLLLVLGVNNQAGDGNSPF